MKKYLFNRITKVLSVEGDMTVSSYEEADKIYETVEAKEVETDNGFMLVGKRSNGEPFESFLSLEEYFNGKQFKLN